MPLTLTPATPRRAEIVLNSGIFAPRPLARLLHLTFISGPCMLVTSRFSGKTASMMIMLCAPALLFCAMLTIPALLFPSPQQQAYFYFSEVLNHDPSRWIGLILAGVCAIIALAVPATAAQPYTALRH